MTEKRFTIVERLRESDPHWSPSVAKETITEAAELIEVFLEALQGARAALHEHFVAWDGEPEDAVLLQLARSKCDAAIAKATQ